MTIIVRDELSIPPSWFASFRDLTLYCSIFIKAEIVIESDQVDMYYRWLKSKGGMDFISDFVRPGSECGLRIDTGVRFTGPVILTDRITPENTHRLIQQVRSHCGHLEAS